MTDGDGFRLGGRNDGEGFTLTLLGESSTLALSRLGASTTRQGRGDWTPHARPFECLRVSGPAPGFLPPRE